MEIILATHNKNKVKEMQNFLSGTFENLTVITASEAGFTEDIEENGTTFEENALIKARAVRKDGAISIADDSGLCVNALDGRPGIFSARYAGEPCDDKKNNAKLLSELEPFEDRTAYFVSAIACVLPDGTEFTVRGVANGVMLKNERGEGGFGYDPLFYFPPLDKTFAELSREEKNGVSHRGNALRLLRDELIKRLK
jgi:XTP/dITP diphosphohydrolase